MRACVRLPFRVDHQISTSANNEIYYTYRIYYAINELYHTLDKESYPKARVNLIMAFRVSNILYRLSGITLR